MKTGNTGLSMTNNLGEHDELLAELQEIIEGSFDGLLVTDGEGNVLLANHSYERNTGIKLEDIVGHNVGELINPVWMRNSVATLAIEQRKTISMHHTTQHGKNIIVTGTPIFDDNETVKMVVVNTRDMSEIYALREELQKTKERELHYKERLENEEKDISINGEIVIANNRMREIYQLASKICNFDTTVLITGSSGVGKELVARYIHNESSLRKDKPFIAVNCGAIPENLLESELFGYEEGAFTGAAKGGKKGLFEAADGGTIFLDEIGEITPSLQVKLLRVLEDRAVVRVGASEQIDLDIRVIAATNKDLNKMVSDNQFREDLFYRLNVINLKIPSLSERKDEIIPLALKFIKQFNRHYGLNKKLSYEVIKELEEHEWPGNIRQLKNVIESMIVISNDDYIGLDDVPWISLPNTGRDTGENGEKSLQSMLDEYEKSILLRAKKKYGSSRKIGDFLKVDQSTIVRKMKKYGI
ncbi:sigma 54-interacting transcriptional regulator [bacterium 210820-DFI.6.37]|nr:sigma 54-interacting transcriptional regulator [bacterium 210820-DFI.6.37]